MTELPEPTGDTADSGVLFARYLDFYRRTVVRKVLSLSESELRTARLPSGWTPIEMVTHLAHMEQRWFIWGFLGEPVAEPWGDQRHERWHVAEDQTLDEVVTMLRDVGARTTTLLGEHPLDKHAALGGRFVSDPPTLAWICFHVLQEYARHAGHLDVAVELAGGDVGE